MSESPTEGDIPRLAVTSATDDAGITAVQECNIQRPEASVRQNRDDIGMAYDNTLLCKAHAVAYQTFAPVQKVPVEILAEIFIQCIPPLVIQGGMDGLYPPYGFGEELQQARSCIGQVCSRWNTILNREPRAWATLSIDELHPPPEIVHLWIKKSKSYPLDVTISRSYPQDNREAILKLLHQELWRIKVLIGDFWQDLVGTWPVRALFPVNVPTVAPMMEELTLLHDASNGMGRIHCPQVQTLGLRLTDDSVKALVDKPMLNVERVVVLCPTSPIIWHFKLLEAMPNLVFMSWNLLGVANDTELPAVPVVLQHLSSIGIASYYHHSATAFLESLDIPSLEYLDLAHYFESDIDHLDEALDALSENGTLRLRHLVLQNTSPMEENVNSVLNHLMHLETLKLTVQNRSVDAMLIALSPHNRDFSSACPKLETVELSFVNVSAGALVAFVERRVQSDEEEEAPGLVSCLKLSGIQCMDEEPCSRLTETHSLSIHLLSEDDQNCKLFLGLCPCSLLTSLLINRSRVVRSRDDMIWPHISTHPYVPSSDSYCYPICSEGRINSQ